MAGNKFTTYLFTFLMILLLLAIGRNIILPFITALFFWFLIHSLRGFLKQIFEKKLGINHKISGYFAFPIALVIIGAIVFWVASTIGSNLIAASQNVAGMDAQYQQLLNKLCGYVGVEPAKIHALLQGINFKQIVSSLFNSLSSLAKNTGLVVIYITFILLEEKSFKHRLTMIAKTPAQKKKMEKRIYNINVKIRKWLGIKTLMSLSTGLVSYAFMYWAGLNNAEFWAVIIILLNYIPTFGSIVGTVLPATVALIQFQSVVPFAIVAGGITSAQIIIGNIIDPKLTGKGLNLSPMVILLSLAVWGTLWGLTGMFLCVPIMVIIMLILSEIEGTKDIARLLSQSGEIEEIE